MIKDNCDSLLMHTLRLIEEINNVSLRISNALVFGKQSLPNPRFTPPELGFLLTVSWLYVLYKEAGNVNIKFLRGCFQAYNLDADKHVFTHIENVETIRTYLHHNLDPDIKQKRDTQEKCEKWLEKQCKTRLPMNDIQWEKCLIALIHETILCLTILRNCVREIEQDESRGEIIYTWNLRRRRYHSSEDFKDLIVLIAADLGRTNINEAHFCHRFYEKWTRDLEMLDGDYDFAIEARRLIEYTLLYEMAKRLPITGKDVMHEFHLPPGPHIEEVLQKARILYEREPYSKENLLARLSQEIGIQRD